MTGKTTNSLTGKILIQSQASTGFDLIVGAFYPKISTYSGYTVICRPITVLKAATFPRNYSNQHSI